MIGEWIEGSRCPLCALCGQESRIAGHSATAWKPTEVQRPPRWGLGCVVEYHCERGHTGTISGVLAPGDYARLRGEL